MQIQGPGEVRLRAGQSTTIVMVAKHAKREEAWPLVVSQALNRDHKAYQQLGMNGLQRRRKL